MVFPADGAVRGALGQPFAPQEGTRGQGKVQALVGLLGLKKGDERGRGEQGVGDIAITRCLH